MRVLCCLDGTNCTEIRGALDALLHPGDRSVGLLYVIDRGPHAEMESKREGLLRPRQPSGRLRDQMQQAEASSARDILQEGLRYMPQAETLQREGRPEREIVLCAAEWRADLIIICARPPLYAGSAIGPKSVGHVARFVLDHAPCPVLLLRHERA